MICMLSIFTSCSWEWALKHNAKVAGNILLHGGGGWGGGLLILQGHETTTELVINLSSW